MATQAIQTFDDRLPVILGDPSGIKPDDWLHDLGTLRQVEYVDMLGLGLSVVHIVHFRPQRGVENLVRGISQGTGLIVWRTLPLDGLETVPEAAGHAQA